MGETSDKRPFAVFDIDGTLIRWQLYHAISDRLVKNGIISNDVFANVKEARRNWKKRDHASSYSDYELKLVQTYEAALAEITFRDYIQAAEQIFDEYKDQTYIYTRNLIKELKEQNYLLFALSASQVEIVAMLATYYGFDDWGGTKYGFTYGKFNNDKYVLKGSEKPKYLKKLITKYNATSKGSIAVGDSEGDIKMLALADTPIAFNPTKKLFEHAKGQGWKIVVERKSIAYELQQKDDKYFLA